MIKSIYEVDELLKESAWNDRILILKDWADSIVQECAEKAEAYTGVGRMSEDVYLDGAPEVSKGSILKVKEQIR